MPARPCDLSGDFRPPQAAGPARFLALFRRRRAEPDVAQLVLTAGDEPPSPSSAYPLDVRSPGNSDQQGQPLCEESAQVHTCVMPSTSPSRQRRSPAFFEIHEKAKIVVIPTPCLRPLKLRRREEVMDRSLQYILQTQRALPIKRDLPEDGALHGRLSGATAPPLAPRAISAVSTRSGRLSVSPTDRTLCREPMVSRSASPGSTDAARPFITTAGERRQHATGSRHSARRGVSDW